MAGEIEIVVSESGKHTGGITALLFVHDHVFSGGSDGLINVWDINVQFQREIPIHKKFAVLTLVANAQNHILSSGRDGSLRYFRAPWRNDNNDILSQTVATDVTALFCVGNFLYTGDDKGIIQKWYNNKPVCRVGKKLEEVKWIIVEGNNLYTVHDSNIIILDIKPDVEDDRDITRRTIPGRGPLILFGHKVKDFHPFLAFITRDGKGITLVDNTPPFKILWTEENAHDRIINAICATDDYLFTAGLDGKVKKWINLEKGPNIAETIDTGKCINNLCVGPNHTVYIDEEESVEYKIIYAGDAEGVVMRLPFSA